LDLVKKLNAEKKARQRKMAELARIQERKMDMELERRRKGEEEKIRKKAEDEEAKRAEIE
jgi:hypothetical protein